MKNILSATLKIIITLFITIPLFSQDIKIVCPYLGPITDTYKDDERKLNLKDNSLLKGVFFQWVNPDRFQWNTFIYQSSNINYSTIWGGHFIFDYYFPTGERGKFVLGSGIEYLRVDMDADSSISPLKNLELLNNIYTTYVRGGYRLEFNNGSIKSAVMPWIGIEYEAIKGNVKIAMDPPGPAPLTTIKEDINDCKVYAMAGINFNAHFYHIFEVELKYYGSFDDKVYYSTANAMLNLFLSKRWGISYRAKYMEIEKGSDLYNIFGIALVF